MGVIGGGIAGLMLFVTAVVLTGRLPLTRQRSAQGTPARAAALLGMLPMMLLTTFAMRHGGLMNMQGGYVLFLAALIVCIGVIYGVAWPFSRLQKP